jgi:hypothetical protein
MATLAAEMFFGLGPALCILGVSALISNVFSRHRQHPIVLWPLLLYGLFFLFVHKHTYYMLPMAPFLCITVGRFLSEFRWKAVGGAVIVLAAALGLVQSLMVLGALKFGYNRFQPMCEHIRSSPGKKVLVVENEIMQRYEPVLRFYCRDVSIQNQNQWSQQFLPGLVPLEYGNVSYFFLMAQMAPSGNDSMYMHQFDKKILGPALLGRMIYYVPVEKHNRMRTFVPETIVIKSVPGQTAFRMAPAIERPSLQVFELPPGFGVFKRTNTQRMHGAGPIFFNYLPPELSAYEDEIEKQHEAGENHATDQDNRNPEPVIHPDEAPEGD